MATNTDLENDELDEIPGPSTSSRKSSANVETVESLKRRQSGLNDKINKLIAERDAAQDALATYETEVQEQERTFRRQIKELQKAHDDVKATADTVTAEKATLESKLNKASTREAAGKLIAGSEAYKGLLPDLLVGDLKLRDDFASDDEFIAYLDRQSQKIAKPAESAPPPADKPKTLSLEERMKGAVPSSATRVVESRNKADRDPIDIAEEMMLYSPDSDEYRILSVELNEATTAA